MGPEVLLTGTGILQGNLSTIKDYRVKEESKTSVMKKGLGFDKLLRGFSSPGVRAEVGGVDWWFPSGAGVCHGTTTGPRSAV